MKSKSRFVFLELVTLGLTGWTGFIYLVLFSLRLSHRMLSHLDLQLIIFGPAALLLVGLLAYELRIHRWR